MHTKAKGQLFAEENGPLNRKQILVKLGSAYQSRNVRQVTKLTGVSTGRQTYYGR